MTPLFLKVQFKVLRNDVPCTSTAPVLKLRRHKVIDMHVNFLSCVYSVSEVEG